MAEASRTFDISWISQALSAAPAPVSEGLRGAAVPVTYTLEPSSASHADHDILQALYRSERPQHVVDLASLAGLEFDEALRSVLRLAARGSLKIVHRDPVANDHRVEITPEGTRSLTER